MDVCVSWLSLCMSRFKVAGGDFNGHLDIEKRPQMMAILVLMSWFRSSGALVEAILDLEMN